MDRLRIVVRMGCCLAVLSYALGFAEDENQTEVADSPRQAEVLIPAGGFTMGLDGEYDYSPAHWVYIDSFYIDRYEVTNAQYLRFCEETDGTLPEFWGMDEFHSGPDYPDYPVVGVSWSDAKDYAEWCGKRLPTEAEWEFAGRGGQGGQRYPWGHEIDTTLANYTFEGTPKGIRRVGSYPPNGFGLYDVTGNAWEWVADRYDDEYYKVSPEKNPRGPEKGRYRVIRGGSWRSGPYCNRVYFRNALPSNWRDFAVGFRCARDLYTGNVQGDSEP